MKITKEILRALKDIRAAMGDYAELSRRSGVAQSTLSRYVNGTTKSIDDDNWERLKEFIVPYLDKVEVIPAGTSSAAKLVDTIRNTAELRECIKDAMLRKGIRTATDLRRLIGYDSSNTIERLLSGKLNWFPDVLSAVLDALDISHDDAPISPDERAMLAPEGIYNQGGILTRPIPIVDWANAASHISCLVNNGGTVMQKWDPETTETALAPIESRRNTQAFRVFGESMETTINDGDILFCEQQYSLDDIPGGKVVIVKFNDNSSNAGTVVCKRYRRVGDIILLVSDNLAGKTFEIKPEEIGWIGVVTGKHSPM